MFRGKNLKAKLRHLEEWYNSRMAHRPQVMTRKLHREIRACLHPDRVAPEFKPRYQRAFVAFEAIKFKLVDD